jgi:hypothetical protein
MPTVFIAGSITIKNLDPMVQQRLMNVIVQEHPILVGDADGADTSIQQFLYENNAQHVTVYCTGATPRNNIGNWNVHSVTTYHKPGSRAYFTAKDIEMAAAADHGLMIWDTKSTGTLSNVIELLTQKKNALVFINKAKEFHKVLCVADLFALVERMADDARLKADTKISLFERLETLRSREQQFEILAAKAAAKEAADASTKGESSSTDSLVAK